jgi:hypothetical protein
VVICIPSPWSESWISRINDRSRAKDCTKAHTRGCDEHIEIAPMDHPYRREETEELLEHHNCHDAKVRGFVFKLLWGFTPTLERQRAWYPQVYNRPELFLCAKCKQTTETPEHMFECADRTEIETCFRDRY